MSELLKSLLSDIVNTVVWLRLCSADEPETLRQWVLQALTCLLRLLVAAAILAGTIVLVASLAGVI